MRLFRSILLSSILPLLALLLAAVFAPAGPPASVPSDAAPAEVHEIAPVAHRTADWLHRLVESTRDFLSQRAKMPV